MSGRLLFLQNGPKKQSVARLDDRFESFGLTVDRYWAYNGEFPNSLDEYDGIFLSGSPHAAFDDVPFIHREHQLIEDAAKREIPILGICFGSQILASALCGRDQVFRRPFCEVGYKWLPTTPDIHEDEIASDIGDSVYMFVWHNDEVRDGHRDMKILASSDLCPNQIWRHREVPAWGIQGHPEITLEQSKVWFEECRERLELDGASIDQLNATADEAAAAKTMLTKFADFCREKAAA
ncbi:type 1 glutamine amidotransferase [Microvirga pudoricolor]|uniref:type 1 glutamine amidotransferase n=1 Tax=Microvirga pudoricolor TaxID=2778729 RepID=UPI00195134CE|nr:type 1 glutamine amidotransferase [Microvirga pudoricolor]MBM6595459.1 type 1 glutamine amidotransferase [Microvirga pudoricolor]